MHPEPGEEAAVAKITVPTLPHIDPRKETHELVLELAHHQANLTLAMNAINEVSHETLGQVAGLRSEISSWRREVNSRLRLVKNEVGEVKDDLEDSKVHEINRLKAELAEKNKKIEQAAKEEADENKWRRRKIWGRVIDITITFVLTGGAAALWHYLTSAAGH